MKLNVLYCQTWVFNLGKFKAKRESQYIRQDIFSIFKYQNKKKCTGDPTSTRTHYSIKVA